jgi:hypothetical protein
MTIAISKTQTITAQDTVFQVSSMSPEIQNMVAIMDEFRQQEMDTSITLTMIRGAIRDVQNQILIAITAAQKAAQETVQTDVPVEEVGE